MESESNSLILNPCDPLYHSDFPVPFTRRDFPDGFVFGAATAAYQYEGAALQGGKGLTNWDYFANNNPEKIEDGTNGNVAIDQYNRFKEDIKLMKSTGLDAYRFSISWARILPGGKLSTGINREGIQFYNNFIDALLDEGIEPYVTLFHWDIPLTLEHHYGGFLSEEIVKDFRDYAELCFFEFGDRVKHWFTFNEPYTYAYAGYVSASTPPAHGFSTTLPSNEEKIGHRGCAKHFTSKVGDAGREPYLVAHHINLSHAAAVATYRKQFQAYQGGNIGMVNVIIWHEPLNPHSVEDQKAAKRAIDFIFGIFVAPMVHGDYPQSVKERVGSRLPHFSPTQAKLMKGSYDFLGVNYYTSYYATTGVPDGTPNYPNYIRDMDVIQTMKRDKVSIGSQAASSWLYVVPWGMYKSLDFINKEYNKPTIHITENGFDTKNNPKHTVEQERYDPKRIEYFREHLKYVLKAIGEGIDIRSYFLWSFCDNYEWNSGYTVRFGIFYVDFMSGNLARYPKRSAIWWANVLHDGKIIKSSSKRQIQESGGNNDSSSKRKRSNN